jgi:hypothetical protein
MTTSHNLGKAIYSILLLLVFSFTVVGLTSDHKVYHLGTDVKVTVNGQQTNAQNAIDILYKQIQAKIVTYSTACEKSGVVADQITGNLADYTLSNPSSYAHSASQIIVTINGNEMTLQKALDNLIPITDAAVEKLKNPSHSDLICG